MQRANMEFNQELWKKKCKESPCETQIASKQRVSLLKLKHRRNALISTRHCKFKSVI